MALFSRSDRTPAALSHREQTGHTGRPMAQGSGPRVEMLAFAEHFAVNFADAGWECIGWHQVRSGGWRMEGQEMHWRLVDGRRDAYQLSAEGKFPEVFRERVQASVAFGTSYDAPERGKVLISARRDLSGATPGLIWSADVTGGASMDDPATADLVAKALAQLQQDYDL